MKFRPCIDIHNGKVKQIVGGSLKDQGNQANENFVSEQDASYYAQLYEEKGITGGHVILLNKKDSEYYPETKRQALLALSTYPGGLQVGGGIDAENACEFLTAGASHVIVTSYVFRDGHVFYENLEKLVTTVGKQRLTMDLSCRKRNGKYYIVTDRWQKFTEEEVTEPLLHHLTEYCDEFLIRDRTGGITCENERFPCYICRRRRKLCGSGTAEKGWERSCGCDDRKRTGSVWRKHEI